LENLLLSADVGIESTEFLIKELSLGLSREHSADTGAAYDFLRQRIETIVQPCARPLFIRRDARPFIVLTIGVNGSGKTTTSAKLAHQLKRSGLSVMLAASDTFRAAAIEQLNAWAARIGVPCISQKIGADAAAVAFDAASSAKARDCDVLIVDTAGRQHTDGTLMDELRKIKRVIQKSDLSAPHEVLLVLDGGTGQNALAQLKQFDAAVGVTGIVVTKLDGTAKGGVLIALARTARLPIRYIGVGESEEDLRKFDAQEYVAALFSDPS
jgi:fused signal recognition particle receptor